MHVSTEPKANFGKIISIDADAIKKDLGEMVRGTVEETLNTLLDEEADRLCGAKRYERCAGRQDYRSGTRERSLDTKAGTVKLQVPKLRSLPFESAIIERYRRRECSVEEALIEMYLAGVSVRRVEDITEALWGSKVSPSTISHLNQKAYGRIEQWRSRKIEGSYPYVYLDGLWFKRSWGGEVKNVAVLIAVGVDLEGYREVLGACEGCKEDHDGWVSFLKHLKERGLTSPKLIVSDKCLGLIESLAEIFPESDWQRCTVHWYRNILKDVPKGKTKTVAAMLKAIHSQEDKAAAEKKAADVVAKLTEMKLKKAAQHVEESIQETLAYMQYPTEHWRKIRTNTRSAWMHGGSEQRESGWTRSWRRSATCSNG